MAVQILIRNGTASQWSTSNPILAHGEIGIATDSRNFKVGDGSTNWNNLPYFLQPERLNPFLLMGV